MIDEISSKIRSIMIASLITSLQDNKKQDLNKDNYSGYLALLSSFLSVASDESDVKSVITTVSNSFH